MFNNSKRLQRPHDSSITLMKKIILLFAFLLSGMSSLFSQAISMEGSWNGLLALPVGSLRIVFHLKQLPGGEWDCRLDSPDQGVSDIPVSEVEVQGDSLHIVAKGLALEYRGVLRDRDCIEGSFVQGGFSTRLELNRRDAQEEGKEKADVSHTEVSGDEPYSSQEYFTTDHPQGISLAGTLTIPNTVLKDRPTIILITGSGPQNRDEEILGHKPFAVLADILAHHGYTIFRYDDRGVGKSTGKYYEASVEDLIVDAKSVLNYVRSLDAVNPENVMLLGHSEGAYIAARLAAEDKSVAAVISIGGPTVPFRQCIEEQILASLKLSNRSEEYLEKTQRLNRQIYDWVQNQTISTDSLRIMINNHVQEYLADVDSLTLEQKSLVAQQLAEESCTPWFREFIRIDPSATWQAVHCPVLGIYGSKDMQVLPNNADRLRELLPQAEVRLFDGLNHLMQPAITGSPAEYGQIRTTISPEVLSWLVDELARLLQK